MEWMTKGNPSTQDILEYNILPARGMEEAALKGVVAKNMDKNFVQRIATQNPNVSRFLSAPDGRRMTHLMSSGDGRVFPRVYNDGNALRMMPRGMVPPESINMGSDASAEWFANNYKRTNPQGYENGGLV